MDIPRAVGMEIKALSNLFKRQLEAIGCCSMENAPTGVQGMVIHFLADNQGKRDIFQRDIELLFSMRRPTATGILQVMEKNGLLYREPVEYDARLKKIILTEKATNLYRDTTVMFQQLEQQLAQDISEDELAQFFVTLEKIRKNAKDWSITE